MTAYPYIRLADTIASEEQKTARKWVPRSSRGDSAVLMSVPLQSGQLDPAGAHHLRPSVEGHIVREHSRIAERENTNPNR